MLTQPVTAHQKSLSGPWVQIIAHSAARQSSSVGFWFPGPEHPQHQVDWRPHVYVVRGLDRCILCPDCIWYDRQVSLGQATSSLGASKTRQKQHLLRALLSAAPSRQNQKGAQLQVLPAPQEHVHGKLWGANATAGVTQTSLSFHESFSVERNRLVLPVTTCTVE